MSMNEIFKNKSVQNEVEDLKNRLIEIYKRKQIPSEGDYLKKVIRVSNVLDIENPDYRPYSSLGLPGGLIYLKHDIPTVLVPDLHARMDFFLSVLFYNDYKEQDGLTNLEKIGSGQLQIVCVGDGFHAESRAIKRWKLAYEEFKKGYKKHNNMDEEMRESLGLMEMVMEVKSSFPKYFHFLKGNHENISNESCDGNYGFYKFAMEGIMVSTYVKKFYTEDFLSRYYQFEKKLPLLAVGENFLVSHSEPKMYFDKYSVIEYQNNPEVIYGLTWTRNEEAEDESVMDMLKYYLNNNNVNTSYYFGGHRPVNGMYNLRAYGKYVQFHNPNKFIIAVISENKDINLNEDIITIDTKTG